MATTTKTKVAVKNRYNELKKMLEDRRRELMSEVQGKIRDVRTDSSKDREVLDQGESSEVDIQEDIEFALIQMKSETLNKIDAALRRLDDEHLRQLLRVRRRDCRGPPAGAAVRGPLQGLRRGARDRRAARARPGAEARLLGALLRHVELSIQPGLTARELPASNFQLPRPGSWELGVGFFPSQFSEHARVLARIQ